MCKQCLFGDHTWIDNASTLVFVSLSNFTVALRFERPQELNNFLHTLFTDIVRPSESSRLSKNSVKKRVAVLNRKMYE